MILHYTPCLFYIKHLRTQSIDDGANYFWNHSCWTGKKMTKTVGQWKSFPGSGRMAI
jgi:hypothetical protein